MESRGSKPITNLTGQVFTRLTVRECVRDAKGRVAWRCDCSCGGSKVVKAACMFSGDTKSCGCLRREVMRAKATKHGACMPGQRTPEYWIHRRLMDRCMNPNDKNWKDYGSRGISVCERWLGEHGFENFLADKGVRPSPQHSIDRWPNNDGNYEPDNTRWATKKEQVDNRRCTRK